MKDSKGITLIALIITVILLIILASVIIATLNGGGPISRANNIATTYNKEASNESNNIVDWDKILDETEQPSPPTNIETISVKIGSITVRANGGESKNGKVIAYQYSLDGVTWSNNVSKRNRV